MWRIKKIFHYDHRTGNAHVMLQRNSKPSKNKNSDLIRYWFMQRYPAMKDVPDNIKAKVKGRVNQWLSGKTESCAIEEAIHELMSEEGETLNIYKPPEEDVIVASGWLPSIIPCVTYDLILTPSRSGSNSHVLKNIGYIDPANRPKSYYIKGIDWMNVSLLNAKELMPFIDWFSSPFKQRITANGEKIMMKAFMKSRWRKADWMTINRENYKTAVKHLVSTNSSAHLFLLDPFDAKLVDCFYAYMELPLKLMLYMDYRWLQLRLPKRAYGMPPLAHVKLIEKLKSDKHAAIKQKWDRIATQPESILLQGPDFMYRADINDYKRLCISIGRMIPDDKQVEDLEQANAFVKKLGRKTCVPITGEGRSTKYIQRVGNCWATVYDIENTKTIIKWLDGIEIFVNTPPTPLPVGTVQTPVVLKHVDDKMHWWRQYSYPTITLEVPEGDFIIGNAHNFSQEDWVEFAKGPKPIAIFGKLELGEVRGSVFYDYATTRHKIKCMMPAFPMCNDVTKISYADACMETYPDAQIYVSNREEKEAYKRFTPATKLKRKWMYNPKRIVTEVLNDGVNIWVKESDGQERQSARHSIMDTSYADANIICTWESYQMVPTAILLCTKNTRPIDVYRVRMRAITRVLLVETSGSVAPSVPYSAASAKRMSLIN